MTSVAPTTVPLPPDVPVPDNWPSGIPIPEIDRMARTVAVVEEGPDGLVYRLEYTGTDASFTPFVFPYGDELVTLGWERSLSDDASMKTFFRDDSVLYVSQTTRDAQGAQAFIIQSEQRGQQPLR